MKHEIEMKGHHKAHDIKACEREINKARLCQSLATLAGLIEKGDERLWPIFESLEEELTRVEQRETRLSKYYDWK
jgi:hypothetical protein